MSRLKLLTAALALSAFAIPAANAETAHHGKSHHASHYRHAGHHHVVVHHVVRNEDDEDFFGNEGVNGIPGVDLGLGLLNAGLNVVGFDNEDDGVYDDDGNTFFFF